MNTSWLRQAKRGQTDIEYALILGSVALAAIVSLALLASSENSSLSKLGSDLGSQSAYMTTLQQFESLTMAFYNANGHWPRTWGTYRFTDIGLNPNSYASPVNGVIWDPNGAQIGLQSNSTMYVDDLNGVSHAIFPGQTLWCQAQTGSCSLSTGVAVNITTLTTGSGN
jgi:Flp pilus assembly pilin Flp